MGAQALRWDFSGGMGNAGGESLFGNDFEEVAASAAATSATASWLPPGAAMRSSPHVNESSSVRSVSVHPSLPLPPVDSLQQPKTAPGNASEGRRGGKKRAGRGKGREKNIGKGRKGGKPDASNSNAHCEISSKTASKSPSWYPGQMFNVQY